MRSELRRLASRRLYRWVGGIVALGITIGGVVAFLRSPTLGFRFFEMDSNLVEILGFPLILVGWLAGASAIGAEWQHRTVTSLLTWEPRRARVFGAKIAAAAIFTAALVGLLMAWFTIAMVPAAARNGTFAGVDGGWWAEYLAAAARVAIVAAAASCVGFSLSTIGKNTAAGFGGGFAYLLIGEPLLRAWKPEWSDWLIGPNMQRIVYGARDFTAADQSTAGAAVILLAWVVAVLVLASWVFDRREMA
jgi:ABC-type transport system involved in multi-copper enzyme maturation permease subunit